MDTIKLFTPIEKVDEEQHMVFGYASTEHLDSQGEVVKKDALAGAIQDYMKWANIREMHQPSAVGKTKKAQVDDKGLYIAAKIVDDNAWKKVKEGVYTAFSIGGRVKTQKGNEITDLTLSEISLVDRPANPECVIDVYKVDMDKKEVKKEEKVEEKKEVKKAEEQVVGEKPVVAGTTENVAGPHNEKKTEPVVETPKTEEKPVVEPKVEVKPVVEEKPKDKPKKHKKADLAELKKCMADVATMAAIVDTLGQMKSHEEFEEMIEGDTDSNQVQQLKDLITHVADVLVSFTQEEVAEIVEDKEEDDLGVMPVMMGDVEVDLKKVEENIKSGKMPTEKEIDAILKYSNMPKTQKNIDLIKWEMAGKIMKSIKEQQALQLKQGMKQKPVEKQGKTISVKTGQTLSEALSSLNAAIKQIEGLLPKEDTKPEAPAQGTETELPADQKDKLRNGVTAGSTMTGGGHVQEKSEKAEVTKVDAKKAVDHEYVAKVESEISSLKEQVKKLMDRPAPMKAKASYVTVEKGFEGGADGTAKTELAKAETRAEELSKRMKNGDLSVQAEATKLAAEIMRLRREANGR